MSNIEKEENKTKTKQSYQEFKGEFQLVQLIKFFIVE